MSPAGSRSTSTTKSRRRVQRATERRVHRRRHTDFYAELGKFAGLIAFPSAAVIGQAELVGEPWRHILSITAIVCGTIWAYCMKPSSIRDVLAMLKKR